MRVVREREREKKCGEHIYYKETDGNVFHYLLPSDILKAQHTVNLTFII